MRLFAGGEHVAEHGLGLEVPLLDAADHGGAQVLHQAVLHLHVLAQHLAHRRRGGHGFALHQIGRAAKKQHATQDQVRLPATLHQRGVGAARELGVAPVLEHARMHQELIHRRQLAVQQALQVREDTLVAFHLCSG